MLTESQISHWHLSWPGLVFISPLVMTAMFPVLKKYVPSQVSVFTTSHCHTSILPVPPQGSEKESFQVLVQSHPSATHPDYPFLLTPETLCSGKASLRLKPLLLVMDTTAPFGCYLWLIPNHSSQNLRPWISPPIRHLRLSRMTLECSKI